MRLLRRSLWGALGVLLALVPGADARPATLKNAARLREGPSGATAQIQMLPSGTRVEVVGESAGWRQVVLDDGRGGYIWWEHLLDGATATTLPPTEAPTRSDGDSSSPRSLIDEMRALRTDVSALRDRDPAGTADLDRLRAQVEQLALAQRDLARWLDEHGGPPTADEGGGGDTIPTMSWLFLAAGLVIGWSVSRVALRRERRARSRIKL